MTIKPTHPPSDQRELVVTRVLNAPRALVYKAWTDPKHAMQWWGPRLYPATHMEMDVRPGGPGAIASRPPKTAVSCGSTACSAR